jgi:flagellar biogenesis protein FliO
MKRWAFLFAVALTVTAMSSHAADPAKPLIAEPAPKIAFKQTQTEGGLLLRVVLGLTIVIAIGYGTVLVLKRYAPGIVGQTSDGTRKINLLETRRLTTRTALFLVEVEGTRFLLAQTGDRVETIHTFPASPSANSRHG